MEFNQAEFGPDYWGTMAESVLEVKSYNIVASLMPDDSWCSTFPVVTLNPGSVDFPNMCFDWDGVVVETPFNPITIATPVCTDTG